MKLIVCLILISSILSACIGDIAPLLMSTTIPTYTISSPDKIKISTPSASNTISPTPIEISTPTIEPTSTQTEVVAEWVTIYGDNGNPTEVIQTSTGDKFEVLVDSIVKDDKLMVIDMETGEWNEVAKIYTTEELMEQVPSKQEMIDFLNSEEIVRSKNEYGQINPLGVGGQYNWDNSSSRELDMIISGPPKLAWFNITEETVLSQFLPVITTIGRENISNPQFLYIWVGAERISSEAFFPNFTETILESRGTHYSYVTKVEEFSEVLIRGRQLNTRIYTWSDPDYIDTLRDNVFESVRLNIRYIDNYGKQNKPILEKIASGIPVPDGSIIGLNGELVLTKTTIDNQRLTIVTAPETPKPTPTDTVEPPPIVNAEWEIIYNDNGKPIEVVHSPTGERSTVLIDSFVYEDRFIEIDDETGEMTEVARIYSMEELQGQVPSKQMMRNFLNSKEIVRSKNEFRSINRLGVGAVKASLEEQYREIESVIAGAPKLAWFTIGNKEVLSVFLPIVTTRGREILAHPQFLYLWLGAEGISWLQLLRNSSEVIRKSGGSQDFYLVKIKELTEVLITGRQSGNRIYTWFDPELIEEFRGDSAENVRLNALYIDNYLEQNDTILANRLGDVPDGSIIGLTGELILTRTTLFDKELTIVTPPPPAQ